MNETRILAEIRRIVAENRMAFEKWIKDTEGRFGRDPDDPYVKMRCPIPLQAAMDQPGFAPWRPQQMFPEANRYQINRASELIRDLESQGLVETLRAGRRIDWVGIPEKPISQIAPHRTQSNAGDI